MPSGCDLPHAGCDETLSNPTEEGVLAALAIYKEQGCDSVVGFGGGSSIDTAKVASLVCPHGGELLAYLNTPIGQAQAPPGPPEAASHLEAGTGRQGRHEAASGSGGLANLAPPPLHPPLSSGPGGGPWFSVCP